MDKQYFIDQISQAMVSGSFLTPKHDPNSGLRFNSYRTVLSPTVSASLEILIPSGAFQLNHYTNAQHLSGIGTFELILHDSGSFPCVGLGILPMQTTGSGQCDRLIVVSGSNQGWHVYASDSNKIRRKLVTGQYILIGSY